MMILMAAARGSSMTINPIPIIIAIVIVALVIAFILILYLRRSKQETQQEWVPEPVDPSMEGLKVREEDSEALSLSEEPAIVEPDEIFLGTSDSNKKDEEEDEMSSNIMDEFAICKLKNGEAAEFIKLLTSTTIIRRGNGKVDEVATSEISQFIGNDSEMSMSRINGSESMWLLESKDCYSLAENGKVIAEIGKAERSSKGYRLLASLKKGEYFCSSSGEKVAQFMCYNEGELLVKNILTGKYGVLDISTPLQTDNLLIMSANASLLILCSKGTEHAEIYSGALCVAAM